VRVLGMASAFQADDLCVVESSEESEDEKPARGWRSKLSVLLGEQVTWESKPRQMHELAFVEGEDDGFELIGAADPDQLPTLPPPSPGSSEGRLAVDAWERPDAVDRSEEDGRAQVAQHSSTANAGEATIPISTVVRLNDTGLLEETDVELLPACLTRVGDRGVAPGASLLDDVAVGEPAQRVSRTVQQPECSLPVQRAIAEGTTGAVKWDPGNDSVAGVDDVIDADVGIASCEPAEVLGTTRRVAAVARQLQDAMRTKATNQPGSKMAFVEEYVADKASELSIEKVLMWMIAPTIDGVPSLGCESARERAGKLLQTAQGEVNKAVDIVVAGSEETTVAYVIDFIIERIPIVGVPTVLLKCLWAQLRSVAIIAVLYGHDLDLARTQHEILWCLVPGTSDGSDDPGSGPLQGTAQKVAKAMVKGAIKQATGVQVAADLCDLASHLYGMYLSPDGWQVVNKSPATRARDYFRPAPKHSLWVFLPALALGWLLPHLLAILRAVIALVRKGLPLAPVLGGAPAAILFAWMVFKWRRRRQSVDALPDDVCIVDDPGEDKLWSERLRRQSLTVAVFTVHALLPMFSAFSALSAILGTRGNQGGPWVAMHWLCAAVLGVYNISASLGRHCEAELSVPHCVSALRCIRQWALNAVPILFAWCYCLTTIDTVLGLLVGTSNGVFGILRFNAFVFRGPSAEESSVWMIVGGGMTFCCWCVSAYSQQRLLDLLTRREVLLRLVGAERVLAASLVLLMRGAAVAMTSTHHGATTLLEFFAVSSPPPIVCCMVVTLRHMAPLLGMYWALVPFMMGATSRSIVMTFGGMGGSCLAVAFTRMWYLRSAELASEWRLLLLIPGDFSAKGKRVLQDWLRTAQKRAIGTAMTYVARGVLERLVRWVFARG